ncbi:apolipoprotein N-acyltransferase [Tepidamorphus sp. 3E244]|uniref:apolipoprotein N-acyltransferase n=1 Tax=Tepidamorphus sp. 3E244 TaxID=3385498 RepID=UPI0038FD1BC0
MLQALAQGVMLQWGWRRVLLAMLAGGSSALAMPPFGFFPVLFFTFPVFVWLLDGAISSGTHKRRDELLTAFAVGWCFGFGYFLTSLWWIGNALLVDAETFGWLVPFATTLLPAGLALFTGLGALIARAMWRPGPFRVFAFAAGLGFAELLRGYIFTGFPWNAYGYALASNDATMQIASLVGLHGMTALALFIFASPAALGLSDAGHVRGRIAVPAIALALLVVSFAYGGYRLSLGEPQPLDARIRIVQPSIPQDQKFDPELASRHLSALMTLSDIATSPESSGVSDFAAVVWPESALPFYLSDEPAGKAALAALIPESTLLVTGLQRYEQDPDADDGYRNYNSIGAIDASGEMIAVYDKTHLVPFGEYLPMQSIMEAIGFRQLTQMPGGFDVGAQRQPISVGNLPAFLPLICYEAIFPGIVARSAPRAAFLLNVTNDAWYGDTPGPRQHLLQARLRAVEEGLPLVRAANNGISALVDARGRIVASLPLNARNVIDGNVPGAMPETLFVRLGVWPAVFILVLLFGAGLFWRQGK